VNLTSDGDGSVGRAPFGVKSALYRLPRVVWLLGVASLLNDVSSEFVAALLPLYLAELSIGGIGIGLIGGAEEAMRSLLSVVSEHISAQKTEPERGLPV
jgi:hypothetical protein